MINQKEIRDSIPEECSITLKHVQVYIDSAKCARIDEDWDQLAHDTDMAARLLLCLCWDAEYLVRAHEQIDSGQSVENTELDSILIQTEEYDKIRRNLSTAYW